MTGSLDFETLVNLHYAGLYRFALSLTRNETEARDLTQQTFYVWAAKGHQLHDPTKVKSWLYTTLHHEFLGAERRHNRFPHYELMEVSEQESADLAGPTAGPALAWFSSCRLCERDLVRYAFGYLSAFPAWDGLIPPLHFP